MKKTALATAALASLLGCSTSDELKAFSSDGCSLFPDRSLIDETDWLDCCFDHDLAYWQGGTRGQRLAADQTLRQCVLERSEDTELADLMYQGVRFGGSPWFYNWYRWGYGWSYERKYAPLSRAEQRQVEIRLEEFHSR